MATHCKVRIVRELNGVFPMYQPTVGKVYDAVFYPEQHHYKNSHTVSCREFVEIQIKGKRIIVRREEYEMLEEDTTPIYEAISEESGNDETELHGLEWLAQRINDGRVINPLDDTDMAVIRGLTSYGMNITKAAVSAHVSKNTARNRIERIRKKTGCDPLDFWDLLKLIEFVRDLEV